MRISDWSSDVCSSDLFNYIRGFESVLYVDGLKRNYGFVYMPRPEIATLERVEVLVGPASVLYGAGSSGGLTNMQSKRPQFDFGGSASVSYGTRSEEHTSELQSLMRISYAVFCLKKKKQRENKKHTMI